MNYITNQGNLPYLLTREQASNFLGVDPKTFDKFVRSNHNLKRFMIGTRERYTEKELVKFVHENSI